MGKKKGNKGNKGAGSKSQTPKVKREGLKAKGKPAKFKVQLKKDIVKNKAKIDELDKKFGQARNVKNQGSSKKKIQVKHSDLSAVNKKVPEKAME